MILSVRIRCVVCGRFARRATSQAKYCWDCARERERIGHARRSKRATKWYRRAHGIVQHAIKAGFLKSLPARGVRCADCARRAECYDHRDYRKPLIVIPVCRSCNKLRGTGKNAYLRQPA